MQAKDVARVEALVEAGGGYDLEVTDLGSIQIPTWETFPTRKYSYVKVDKDGTEKAALAAMLNPRPNQVARWIVSAVVTTKTKFDFDFASRLVDWTVGQSGFQFLVRGLHLEAMDNAPKHTAYPFFDGVTVKLDTIPAGWTTNVLTDEEIASSIAAANENVTAVGKYARIQSTERDDYTNAGGGEDAKGPNWLSVTRKCYQDAWGMDDNFLMTAKALALKSEWGV